MFGLGFSPWWMDPFVYEWSYHNISLDDPAIGLFGTADITAYVSGWQTDKNTEYWTILGIVAQTLKASDKKVQGPSSVPIDFEYKGQIFHKASIRRAFEGRAAPDEIRDATRLAFLAGRVRTPVSGPAYAKTWFGIDCNSFAGNYCGISPSTSIAAYARGYTDAALKNGATEDVKTSRGLIPVPPVSSPDAIKAGTLLLTFGSADKNGNRWRHIAVVQDCTLGGRRGDRLEAQLSIAEWGTKGGSERHTTAGKTVSLDLGYKCPDLPGKTCIAYDGSDPQGSAAKRIFFDGSRFDNFEVRGAHVYNASGQKTYDT
jgi:hypothetical protein